MGVAQPWVEIWSPPEALEARRATNWSMLVVLHLFTDSGAPLRATCVIQSTANGWSIVIESRGGKLGSAQERNADYAVGFHLILHRLAQVGAVLEDATLASTHLLKQGLSDADRRLVCQGFKYPHKLNLATIGAVEHQLRRAQADVGSLRSKGGGNTTRRVRLTVRLPEEAHLLMPIADYITGAHTMASVGEQEVQQAADQVDAAGGFQPDGVVDARMKELVAIAKRQGQPVFRRALLVAYGCRCPISECDAVEVLEAAHIVAYAGPHTNQVQNGILLRADLHTLFDRGLIGVAPDDWRVVVHQSLLGTAYGRMHNKPFSLPAEVAHQPNRESLVRRNREAGLTLST